MARIRSIKPEAFTSETLSGCSVAARWTFAGLWTVCDDDGRARSDPRLIKGAIWPLDDDVTAKDVAAMLDELESAGLICRYEAQGKGYLHAVNFTEHQKPNRPTPSKLPACCKPVHGGLSEDSRRTQANSAQPPLTDDSVSDHGALNPTSFTNTPTPLLSPTTGVGEVDGEGDGGEKTIVPAKPPRDDALRLCTHLANRIEANGSKRPTITQKWLDAARLLIDNDGRTEEQVTIAIDWCQDSEFWRGNILSMPKLREKYDQLRMQAMRDQRPQRPPAHQPTDDEFEALRQNWARPLDAIEAGQ